MAKLRIAILTHSTNPRGGVIHALELGDALVRLGHSAVVHAPDVNGHGFFRLSLCETAVIPSQAAENVAALVAMGRAAYRRYFGRDAKRDFDVFHAQDSISANALADLKEDGAIARFARTVHHVDSFDEPTLAALQHRGIAMADRHFVVSRHWQAHLAEVFGVKAEVVGNGVDTATFSPTADAQDAAMRARLPLGRGPILLAVGGIEDRKNSVRLLQAFKEFWLRQPSAQLVIAGGASLLDHRQFRAVFQATLSAMALPTDAVIVTGSLPQTLMPPLYRCADMLVFPSVKEGFGLAVLEAMASGIPVATSRIAPFTEYLNDGDAAWCDPYDVESITAAMRHALNPPVRTELVRNGAAVAARHEWRRTADAHLDAYASLRELQNA